MRRKNDELYGRIIEYVNRYFEQTGHSPSTREIEQGVGVPRPTVQRYELHRAGGERAPFVKKYRAVSARPHTAPKQKWHPTGCHFALVRVRGLEPPRSCPH